MAERVFAILRLGVPQSAKASNEALSVPHLGCTKLALPQQIPDHLRITGALGEDPSATNAARTPENVTALSKFLKNAW